MIEKKNDNLKTINELINYEFVVEEYQRGYKWGIEHINELLFDINNFKIGVEQFYCLQPVVVTKIDGNKYELIDGQQRLTTIYIILKCLGETHYALSYKTRNSSEQFLKTITSLSTVILHIKTPLNVKEIDEVLNTAWETYISTNPKDNNVDNYHFFRAYHFIKNWTDNNTDIDKFKNIILNQTKVIWYLQQESVQNAETIFINFNQGKIALAQAELIKALFVLQLNQEKNIELKTFKLNQFAEEWNGIENLLQDRLFWFFLSNDASDGKKHNRIDLLFGIIKNKGKSNNILFSYHKYLEEYNNNSILNWGEVRDLFNQLFEWYDDRELYHLIGFIVYQKIKSITEIRDIYNKLPKKTDFVLKLKQTIAEYLYKKDDNGIQKKFNIDTMLYGSNNVEITTILVLFNIATYTNSDFNYRFPFDRLKKEKWSLEHIHAQNTDNFKTSKEVLEWSDDILGMIDYSKSENPEIENVEINLTELTDNVNQLKEKINEEKNEKISKDLKDLIRNIEEKINSLFSKDNISNLCLLDGGTNSSLGKNFFKQKRDAIIDEDTKKINKDKVFIPMATKNVFLKYYTKKTENIQMTYWGMADRDNYLEAIKNKINTYLEI